eukprot:TRINITY_DN24250_c0_g1_i2.p1 TRINITY_DN24250_c0_g1~~TRINITY_DN24250_c0_g1_i2.p1  ORF type:complete len:175 (+),score=8.22 TRINITY_DN24250_c0_g1_i2:109-633(+)
MDKFIYLHNNFCKALDEMIQLAQQGNVVVIKWQPNDWEQIIATVNILIQKAYYKKYKVVQQQMVGNNNTDFQHIENLMQLDDQMSQTESRNLVASIKQLSFYNWIIKFSINKEQLPAINHKFLQQIQSDNAAHFTHFDTLIDICVVQPKLVRLILPILNLILVKMQHILPTLIL